jgi:hypothetical protein
MVKSRISSCVALIVSAALISPTTVVTARPGQARAPGGTYLDCPTELANAARLEKGLQTLNEMIDRTQRQIDDARNAEGHLNRDAQRQATQAQRELASGTVTSVLSDNILGVRRGIEKLLQSTLKGKALPLLKALNDIKAIEAVFKRMNQLIALGNWRLAIQEAHTFAEQTSAFGQFCNDAGIAEQLGAMLATKAAIGGTAAGGAALSGLVGGLVVAAGIYAITTVAADQEAFQNALDQQAAADTVNQLRRSRSTYQDQITSVRSTCSQQPRRAENSNPAKDPPAPPTPPTASGGPGLGSLLVLGGLGFAGYAGVKYYQQQNQGCLKQGLAALKTYDACFASSSVSSSACRAFFAEADSCCRQEGQSGYDKSVGACY